MKNKVGRPATGETMIRKVRVKRWDEIPGVKAKFINAAIDKALNELNDREGK